MSEETKDVWGRAIAGMIAGACFVGVYLSLTASNHTECTQYAGHGDGKECVGDYVTVEGPDKGGAFVEFLLGGVALAWAVGRKENEQI